MSEDKLGNDAADTLAVAGALLHEAHGRERRRALERLRLAKRVQAMMLGIVKARAVGIAGRVQDDPEVPAVAALRVQCLQQRQMRQHGRYVLEPLRSTDQRKLPPERQTRTKISLLHQAMMTDRIQPHHLGCERTRHEYQQYLVELCLRQILGGSPRSRMKAKMNDAN